MDLLAIRHIYCSLSAEHTNQVITADLKTEDHVVSIICIYMYL